MEEAQIIELQKLVEEYTNKEYLDSHYFKLLFYRIEKGKLIINLQPEGNPQEHTDLIKEIVIKIYNVLPKGITYKLEFNGWYCDIINGEFNINFIDGRYKIKDEHQKMHERKEIATIGEVLSLNSELDLDIKWSLLKKKSIELGFVPVKEKNGFENLYLTEAFKQCYPSLNYDFDDKNVIQNKLIEEPKKKKFFGLF